MDNGLRSLGQAHSQRMERAERLELQQQLKEALSTDVWGSSNVLQKIALASKDGKNRALILDHIRGALAEKHENWRTVYRCLCLVEVLLKRGNVAMIRDIMGELWRIQKWRGQQIIENREEVAERVRLKATLVTELCLDTSWLNQARDSDYDKYAKMTGITVAPSKSKDWVSQTGRWIGLPPTEAFSNITGASPSVAEDMLQQNGGDLRSALDAYLKPADVSREEVPMEVPTESWWIEAARRCEYVKAKLRCSEPQARLWLHTSDWDVDWAISIGQASTDLGFSVDHSMASSGGFGNFLGCPGPSSGGKGMSGPACKGGGLYGKGGGFRSIGSHGNAGGSMDGPGPSMDGFNIPSDGWGCGSFGSGLGCQPIFHDGFQQGYPLGLQMPGLTQVGNNPSGSPLESQGAVGLNPFSVGSPLESQGAVGLNPYSVGCGGYYRPPDFAAHPVHGRGSGPPTPGFDLSSSFNKHGGRQVGQGFGFAAPFGPPPMDSFNVNYQGIERQGLTGKGGGFGGLPTGPHAGSFPPPGGFRAL